MTQQFFVVFVPGDLDLDLRTPNRQRVPTLIVLRLVVRKLSCGQTNKQTPLKTSTSLRYAPPVGNQRHAAAVSQKR